MRNTTPQAPAEDSVVKHLFFCLCLLLSSACNVTPNTVPQLTAPPPSLVSAETVPPRPTDVAAPLAAVVWTLNYDLNQFDTVWNWLHTDVPASAERARAIGAAALIAVAELDRPSLLDEGVTSFERAATGFPDDGRLPLWRAYLLFVKARHANNDEATRTAIEGLRKTTKTYPSFTIFGLVAAIGGWEDASPELIEEARVALASLATLPPPLDVHQSRRSMDTPIAPYNTSAMQLMIGDLDLRAGKKNEFAYYTALNSNNGNRWPWRGEVERRMKNIDAAMSGLAARPATESMIGAQMLGEIGVKQLRVNSRFGGRIGNGSCTICHTHVSTFDLGEPTAEVGWAKVKALPIEGHPNALPVGVLLPRGENPIPGGFAFGPYVDAAAERDFFERDALFDGTLLIPAAPGTYSVTLQADINGQKYQGYASDGLGALQFIEVKAGQVTDLSAAPIKLTPAP